MALQQRLGRIALALAIGAALPFLPDLLSRAWVMGGVALFLCALAASLFGAFELQLPGALQQRLVTVRGVGYGSALGMGLVAGIIAAPCTGPVLVGVLAYVATSRSAVL